MSHGGSASDSEEVFCDSQLRWMSTDYSSPCSEGDPPVKRGTAQATCQETVSLCGVSVQFGCDRLFHGRRFPTSEIGLGQHVWDPCLRAKRQSPEALAIDRAPLGHTLCRPGWLGKQLPHRDRVD